MTRLLLVVAAAVGLGVVLARGVVPDDPLPADQEDVTRAADEMEWCVGVAGDVHSPTAVTAAA